MSSTDKKYLIIEAKAEVKVEVKPKAEEVENDEDDDDDDDDDDDVAESIDSWKLFLLKVDFEFLILNDV